ncbi:MAG: hypothetical protein JM58_03195 [Peptococcaceae bacterium BICA1-8]|nr:MAG: hypothetical protein JM58_03195 [Peptococcaceae bacterium BICA1-8]
MSFNNWKYEYQYDFYLRQIQNGEINISLCTIIFFNDYFSNNPSEIRSLPAYSLGQVPNWDELSKYIYEKATNVSYETGITEEQFDNLVKKYFGNINYTHKSSHYLTLEDGRYIPIGWSDHGGYIYELTSLEKDKTQDGKNKWKAAITGYYFNEMDGSPDEPVSNQSKNAQAVWEEMKKEDYKGLNHWQARDRLVWNNPDSILEPSRQWVIEFVVNNPMDDVYFTYLSCQ